MKVLAIVAAAITTACMSMGVQAATHYVRADATGNGSGSDWTNAYKALPTTLVRGDTYYIADGTYGSYRFNTPLSGNTKVTVRKATANDHGTNTGWSAAYGDGEALFRGASPVWQFSTGHVEIDGQVGKGKAEVPYGFRVLPSTSRCVNEFSSAVMYAPGSNITNLTISHVDFSWDNGTASCTSAVPALFYTHSASSDYVTIENSYFHHAPGYAHYIGGYDPNPGGAVQNHYTIRNNYYYMLGGGGSADHHWELMWLMNVDNSEIYNNVIEDVVGSAGQTGWVMMAKANNMRVHGNSFFCTSASCIVGGNGVIATWSADAYRNDNVMIYNNTFANLKGVFNTFGIRFKHNSVADTNIVVRNNLYYNARFSWEGVNSQSNEACGGGQACAGTNQQTGLSTSSFVNYAGKNFRLTAATSSGDATIASTVKSDMDGKVRGADGRWDRGAFEFGSSNAAIQAPTNLSVQ